MSRGQRNRTNLLMPSLALVALIILHDLDHVRQGRALSLEVYGVGAVAFVAGLIMLVLALRSSELSSLAGVAVGFGTIAGVLAVHVAPHWWLFSDSYAEADADLTSWVIIFAMMAMGLWLGVTGLIASRSPGVRITT